MEQHQHYQSLQDQAYNALRSKIIYAELKPGTRLSAIGLEKETESTLSAFLCVRNSRQT